MKSRPNFQNSKQKARSEEEESSDSDCEIMEPQISVIELNDSIEEQEVSIEDEDVAIIEDDKVIVDLAEEDESPSPEYESPSPEYDDSVIAMDESNSNKSPEPQSDTVLTIRFGNSDKYELLRELVKEAVQKCLEERCVSVDIVDRSENMSLDFIERAPDGDGADIFAIDTTPAEKPEIKMIPSYRRSIRQVIDDEKKAEIDEDTCVKVKRMSTCFNCSGTHALKDCPEPRNQTRISKAKRMFAAKNDRYHIDIEQRYAHIKPGKVSESLRKAMGLRAWELPPFIYRMRLLGYPPGWLEEAKVSHSGLQLYDSEGRQVQGSDEEDGEINIEKHKYDVRKIISFPGFNCDTESGIVEDRRMPPMLPEDQKDKFIESLGGNVIKGYKRKKLKNLTALDPDKSQDSEMMDMEIEDPAAAVAVASASLPPAPPPPTAPEFITLLPYTPIYSVPPPPPLPPPKEDESAPHPPPECLPPGTPPPAIANATNRKRTGSPTLEDLEAKQRALLQALENSASQLDATTDDSLIDDILELRSQEDASEDSTSTPNGDTTIVADPKDQVPETPSSPKSHEMTEVPNSKLSVFGTPVLKFSPYDQLPTGQQFSVGVSDVINFENLPDSTGKYEKMVKVIEKVRIAVRMSNEEN